MEPKKLYEHLVASTEQYLLENNLESMVLGISGGIDSTLVAAICSSVVEKNPKFKLIGVSMPTTTNEKDETDAADLVGQSLCTIYEVKPIQEIFEKFVVSMTTPEKQSKLANGNIKARLRMTYLYNVASLNSGIVMSTENLTETLTGFWTLHGDEGDLGPIETLYKHEVYELCNWLILELQREQEMYSDLRNEGKVQRLRLIEEAIKASMKLVPTDGNGVMPGGDLAQIAPGRTYDEVDEILNALVSFKSPTLSAELYLAILKNGPEKVKHLLDKYDEETILRVAKRYVNSRFKRKHRPFVITINGVEENNFTT